MQSWIVKVTSYKLDIANQTNSVLVMYNVNIYSSNPLSSSSTTGNGDGVDAAAAAAVYAKYRVNYYLFYFTFFFKYLNHMF